MITIGPFPAVTVDKARGMVRAHKSLLAENFNPKEVRKEKQTPTFRDFLEKDFIPYAKKQYKTYRNVKSTLQSRLLPHFSNTRLGDISKADIVRYHEALRDEVSAITANRCLSMLSSIFNRAIDLEIANNNPAAGVKKFFEGDGRDRFLNDEELGRFICALKSRMDNAQVKAIFLLLTLGLRKSEVLSFKWSNIDLLRNVCISLIPRIVSHAMWH
jgi:integrase